MSDVSLQHFAYTAGCVSKLLTTRIHDYNSLMYSICYCHPGDIAGCCSSTFNMLSLSVNVKLLRCGPYQKLLLPSVSYVGGDWSADQFRNENLIRPIIRKTELMHFVRGCLLYTPPGARPLRKQLFLSEALRHQVRGIHAAFGHPFQNVAHSLCGLHRKLYRSSLEENQCDTT